MKRALVAALLLSLTACGSTATKTTAGGPPAKVVTSTSPTPKAATPQPFNVGGFLASNIKPTLPAGQPGQVSVVAIGSLDLDGIGGGILTVAFRNNTNAPISHVDLSATARHHGTLVGSGSSQGIEPAWIQPGEVGFGYIYFSSTRSMSKTGMTYEFTADTMAADTSALNTAPIKVSEATYNGSAIIGSGVNATGKTLSGPYSVGIFCFSGGKLSSAVTSGFADQNGDVAPNGHVSFTVDLYGKSCAHFVVGIDGFFN